MINDTKDWIVQDFLNESRRYRATAEKALEQVSDKDLNRIVSPEGNSIAMIVRHISGNLVSRFTDFLTTDGDKPWRNRDSEFETREYSRQEIQEMWQKGWTILEEAVRLLSEDDLAKKVFIRGQAWTVHGALVRSVAHTAYHVGQIVLLARMFAEAEWKWISIPKGMSGTYNRNPKIEKEPAP